jgi:hypothetical protein
MVKRALGSCHGVLIESSKLAVRTRPKERLAERDERE